MSAHPCGCDPEAHWRCREYPECAYGRYVTKTPFESCFADEAAVVAPKKVSRAEGVFFACGCSEKTMDGVLTRTYCPNGECRRLKR